MGAFFVLDSTPQTDLVSIKPIEAIYAIMKRQESNFKLNNKWEA